MLPSSQPSSPPFEFIDVTEHDGEKRRQLADFIARQESRRKPIHLKNLPAHEAERVSVTTRQSLEVVVGSVKVRLPGGQIVEVTPESTPLELEPGRGVALKNDGDDVALYALHEIPASGTAN